MAVAVNLLSNVKKGKKKNYARCFMNCDRSQNDGTVTLRLMSGMPYVVPAPLSGFLPFGSMGERLVVTMKVSVRGRDGPQERSPRSCSFI